MTRPDLRPLTVRSGRVRQAGRLSQRTVRRQRREFLAEGPQAVREALGASDVVLEVFATAAATARHPELPAAALADNVRWHQVGEDVIAALSQTVTPQGVVARCRFLDVPSEALFATSPRLVAVLSDIRDPGNAGTVLRCADAAGAAGVVFTGESVDPYNPKAVRSSAGSLFHLPLVVEADLAGIAGALRRRGVQLLAADADGAVDLDEAMDRGLLRAPTAWLFGNEARGLSDHAKAIADTVLRVPLHGRAESLNLATAAAVCLYASAREQRRSGAGPVPTTAQ